MSIKSSINYGQLTTAEVAWVQQGAGLTYAKGTILVSDASGNLQTLGVGTDAQILTADSVQTLGVKWSSSGGGAHTLDDGQTDVTISLVTDNEVLAYDSATSEWINQTAAEAGLAVAVHTHATTDITSGTLATARGGTNLDTSAASGIPKVSAGVWSINATQDDLGNGVTYKQYNPASVAITGGSIAGITDLAIADGGTGASTASVARTNLGLEIGVDVQAYNAGLTDIAGLAKTDNNFIVGNGTNWVAESGAVARTSLGLGNVENTALSTWAGTTNITTLGTIGTGIWQATAIAYNYGGTGLTAYPKRTIILTAAGGWPSTTSGSAANVKVEYATNDVDLYHLDFDASVQEYAQWTIIMPDSYDGGTITARFIWSSTGTSGDVIWGLQGRAYGDAETIDQAWGTGQEITDTQPATANQVLISSATSAITLAGTPAGGELVQFRVYRKAADAGDTLTVDARLIAVQIEYTLNSWTD